MHHLASLILIQPNYWLCRYAAIYKKLDNVQICSIPQETVLYSKYCYILAHCVMFMVSYIYLPKTDPIKNITYICIRSQYPEIRWVRLRLT